MAYSLTLTGTPTFTAAATGFGNALTLNGSTQYATVPEPSSPFSFAVGASWTMEARFKTSQTTGQPIIVGQKDGGGTAVFYLCLLDGTPQFHLAGFGTDLTSGSHVADGAWHSIAVQCYNGTRIVLFIDGVKATSSTGTVGAISGTPTTWIGGWSSAGNYWTGQLDEVAVSQAALYSDLLGYTPATAPFAANRGGQQALYHFEADGTDSNTANATAIAPNNAALIWSPYNWQLSATAAISANPGAYLRTLFTGTTARLRCDLSGNTDTPYPVLAARIDGGAWAYYALSGIIDLTPVVLANTRHYLEVVLSAQIFSTQDRWGTSVLRPVASATITGLFIDTGGVMRAPTARPFNVLVYGDSITDGTKTLGTGGTDVANDDAIRAWPRGLLAAVPAEVGVVAFSGQAVDGTAHTSTVPALKNTWNLLQSTVSRTFSPVPDLVVYLHGQNDDTGASAVTADLVAIVQGILAVAPLSKHMLLRPLSGNMASAVQTAVTQIANPVVTYVDTTGWMPGFTSLDSADGVHPLAAPQLGVLADKLGAAVQTALAPAASGGSIGALGRRGLGR